MSGPPSRHLIIVCCHAIWTGKRGGDGNDTTDCAKPPGADAKEWLLEGFQAGEHEHFRKHVVAGLMYHDAWGGELWFSGGPTKRDRTELSEGESYHNLAREIELTDSNAKSIMLLPPYPGSGPKHRSRTATDAFATDSLQNILFPLLISHVDAVLDDNTLRDQGLIGRITIIGHPFKKHRFVDHHLPTLGFSKRWIEENVTYEERFGVKEMEQGELRAIEEWKSCPWGDAGSLAEKRMKRGWNLERKGEMMGWFKSRDYSGQDLEWAINVISNDGKTNVAGRVAVNGGQ